MKKVCVCTALGPSKVLHQGDFAFVMDINELVLSQPIYNQLGSWRAGSTCHIQWTGKRVVSQSYLKLAL